MHILSVSSLNEQIKSLVEESFSRILVEGELSRITYHNSGHIYFSLKDEESIVKAVIFKTNAIKLKFQLQEGQKVILDGAISLYKPRGEYQINAFSIEPSGKGALALAYEQLKTKLKDKGYFDESIKKPLPKFPKNIAFITSLTGAALQDMLRVANHRYRLLSIDIYDVLVQGESASFAISEAIIKADTKNYDTIIIARGGGSIEDLWAFNEERVADAIFAAKTPIVSAIGHEIDWVISDFVADLRAATPSAAMQLVLPDESELFVYLDTLHTQITQKMAYKLSSLTQELSHMNKLFASHSIEHNISQAKESIAILQNSFSQAIDFRLSGFKHQFVISKNSLAPLIDRSVELAKNQLNILEKMIESVNPKQKSRTGFVQISKESKVIDILELSIDDEFDLMDQSFLVRAKVLNKEKL